MKIGRRQRGVRPTPAIHPDIFRRIAPILVIPRHVEAVYGMDGAVFQKRSEPGYCNPVFFSTRSFCLPDDCREHGDTIHLIIHAEHRALDIIERLAGGLFQKQFPAAEIICHSQHDKNHPGPHPDGQGKALPDRAGSEKSQGRSHFAILTDSSTRDDCQAAAKETRRPFALKS